MKSTSFCYCLATLIVALPNSEVQCYRSSPSSTQYPVPNEPNKTTNSSSYSKISSTNPQSSDRKSYDRQELAPADKQDTKRRGTKSSTTKSQNLSRSNVNVPTDKGVTDEYETSTQLGRSVAGSNQNWRLSSSEKAYNRVSSTQAFKNTEWSTSEAEYSSSTMAELTDNWIRTTIPTGFGSESTILTTKKWTSTPSTTSTSTKSNSRFVTKPMTAGPFVATSRDQSFQTTARFGYTSTDSSVVRADKAKENDNAIVFPAATTARATSKTTATSSGSRYGITIDSTTVTPEHKFIYDVPEFTCPEGEKKDSENKCRKVM